MILKSQQRLKNEKHVFIEESIKIALTSNDDKRMQSIDSIEKDIVREKEDIRCNFNVIKWLTLVRLQKINK